MSLGSWAHRHIIVSILGLLLVRLQVPAAMLCNAAAQDDIVMMESFTENGIDPNCGDYDNRTALHLAASGSKLRVAEFLVRKGADVNAVDRWGNTPMVDALSASSDIMVKLLRCYGGSLPKGYGVEQLLKASGYGNIFMIDILLCAGVNVNSVDYDQRTALHEAAREGEVDKGVNDYLQKQQVIYIIGLISDF